MESGYRVAVPPVEQREVLHYLGWRGAPLDRLLLRQIEEAETQLAGVARPSVITRTFPYAKEENLLAGTSYAPAGQDIRRMLGTCDSVILMAATLGEPADRLIRRTMLRGDGSGLVMDAVASGMIEAVCNQEQNRLSDRAAGENRYLTDRFSPGYGDMPLMDGRRICDIMETSKRIGLSVSESGIMIPQKSVSALIGISCYPQPHRPSPCSQCGARFTCALAENVNVSG